MELLDTTKRNPRRWIIDLMSIVKVVAENVNKGALSNNNYSDEEGAEVKALY